MKIKLIAFIAFLMLTLYAKGQQPTAYSDSLITIDYAKAYRIQTDLLSIPLLKQIIDFKNRVIESQTNIINSQKVNQEALKSRISTLELNNKEKARRLRKRGFIIATLTAAIVTENILIIRYGGI